MIERRDDHAEFCAAMLAVLPDVRAFAYSLARSRDRTNDLVQETVKRALIGRNGFLGGSIKAWLFVICKNEWRNELRKKHEEQFGDETPDVPVPADEGAASEWAEGLVLLSQLPKDQQEAMLAIALGEKYEDVAARLGVAVGTVKSRVGRGREALRRMTGLE